MAKDDFEAWAFYVMPIDIHDDLRSLAVGSGQEPLDVLRKSLHVFQVCLDARRRGKTVWVIGEAEEMEQELVGFEAPASETVHQPGE